MAGPRKGARQPVTAPFRDAMTRAMEKQGLTAEQLGSLAGVTESTISRIRTGETKTSTLLPVLAEILQISVPSTDEISALVSILIGLSDEARGAAIAHFRSWIDEYQRHATAAEASRSKLRDFLRTTTHEYDSDSKET